VIASVVAAFVACFATFFALDAVHSTNISVLQGMHVDYRVSPPETRSGRLSDELEVTPDGIAIVRSNGHLLQITPEGLVKSLDLDRAGISSYAVDTNDTMLTISHGYLGKLSQDGDSVHAIPLPNGDSHLAHSQRDGVVYLYTGNEGAYDVYAFAEAGSYESLLHSDERVVDVSDNAADVFVATPHRVIRVTQSGGDQVFAVQDSASVGQIISIAAAPDGTLFVSTPTRVYAVIGLVAISIINDSGGRLQLRGDQLYVLDSRRQMLYVVSPASEALFQGEHS
jgi:hypothetical protein